MKTMSGLMILMILSLAFFVVVMPAQAASEAPTINSITPTQTTADTFTLTITGSNFDSGAVDQIYWEADGHFVGQGTVQSRTSSEIVVQELMTGATPGAYIVKVKNLDGQISNGVTLTIESASEAPTINSITPTQTTADTFTLTITGSNFDSGAVDQIYWEADGHFVGQGTVQSRTSSEIVVQELMTGATPGAYIVKVKNLDGQISNGVTLTISAMPSQAAQGLKITDTNLNALQNQGTWESYGSGELLVFDSAKDLYAPHKQSKIVGNVNALTVADYQGYYWGECVSFAKALSQSIKVTKNWKTGRNVVLSGDVTPGTVIATFDGTDNYDNDQSGNQHTAIFRDYIRNSNGQITGIKVWDQNYVSPKVVGRHDITSATKYYVVQI